ncbi:MAG: branched-chain amino acid ABC transporter permease [Acidimicrobiia bacterium]
MTTTESPARKRSDWFKENRTRATTLAVLIFVLIAAMSGVERDDWFSTIMQGLSVGAITFLVASGLSLIFGLMDVLNLAHGELFMLGAYAGWTVYTRFDTVVDVLVPVLVLSAPFALLPLWRRLAANIGTTPRRRRWGGLTLIAVGGVTAFVSMTRFPLVIWDPENFALSPSNFSVQIDLGTLAPLPTDTFGWPAAVAILVTLIGGALLALGFNVLREQTDERFALKRNHLIGFVALIVAAVVLLAVKEPLNEWVFGLSTTWRFFLAMIVSVALGSASGALIEVALIRPLYDRPIYQLMVTLGVGFIIIELVREIWGRPEFTMSRPAAFNGTGPGCPAEGLDGFFSGCSTLVAFGSRLRVYNEGFVVLVGILVLVGVTLLLRRTRIGMIIRAGVQDPEMVEALGINVRRVFTLVFALGSGLAAFGGVLAAPSIGLSSGMGAVFLLSAIVALAIGGLTSFPGAAAGAVLVGLLQQIIIRYGQSGINLPFLDEPFKPSPTLVPAAAILLMIVVLLALPAGLFGRSER